MAKRKNKNKNKKLTPMARFRNAFRSTKRPWKVISEYRTLVSKKEYPEMINYISGHLKLGLFLDSFLIPKELSKVLSLPQYKPVSLGAELEWATALIIHYREKVRVFLPLQQEYNYFLEEMKFKEAMHVLDKIENDVCCSQWVVERKIGLNHKIGGLEQNKKYVSQISEGNNLSSYLRHIVYIISTRNEDTISVNWLKNVYNDLMSSWKINDGIKSYFRYKTYRPLAEVADFKEILNCEASSSVIDIYESLIFTISRIFEKSNGNDEQLKLITERLYNTFSDYRLNRLLFLMTDNTDLLDDAKRVSLCALDSLKKPDHVNTEDIVKEASLIDNRNMYSQLACAKIHCDSNNELTGDDGVIFSAYKVLQKNLGFYEHYNNLIKLSINNAPTYYEFAIENFLIGEFSSRPFGTNIGTNLLEFIYSDVLSPTQISLLPSKKNKESFIVFLAPFYQNSLTFTYYRHTYGSQDVSDLLQGMSREYQLMSKLEINRVSDKPIQLLDQSFELSQSPVVRLRRYGGRYYSNELIKAKNYKTLLIYVGLSLLKDSGAVHTLPMSDISNILDSETRREFKDLIDVPIILEIIKEYHPDDDDRRLIYAYEDYLSSAGVLKPSALVIDDLDVHKDQIKYFLEKICTPNIMSNSIEFEGSHEVENERIKVCQMLILLNPKKSKEYEVEIEQILRSQVIKSITKQVEQSKIYVDIENIRAWGHKNLQTNFSRFINHVNANLSLKQSNFSQNSLFREYDTPRVDNEKNDILNDMLSRLMREFFLNSAYGLDSYLSIRMRHHVISTHLREPLTKYNVITEKKVNSEEYEENSRWVSINENNQDIKFKLESLLNEFSKNIDNLIKKISDENIRIKSSSYPDGLIYAILPNSLLNYIGERIEPETTLDKFIDIAFETFWGITANSLERIRKHIREEYSKQFTNLFDRLHNDVGKINNYQEANTLQSHIGHSRIEIVQALENFEEWFKISEESSEENILVEDVAMAALASVQKARIIDVKPELTYTTLNPAYIKGHLISVFNDIFFVLFENIMKRSGIQIATNIAVTEIPENGFVFIKIENKISESTNIENTENILNEIRESITDGTYLSKINQEGKTGLRKLRKFVGSLNEGYDPHLEFGIDSDRMFFVSFRLKVNTSYA